MCKYIFEFNLLDLKEQHKLAELLWAINEFKQGYMDLLAKTEKSMKWQLIRKNDISKYSAFKNLRGCA